MRRVEVMHYGKVFFFLIYVINILSIVQVQENLQQMYLPIYEKKGPICENFSEKKMCSDRKDQ